MENKIDPLVVSFFAQAEVDRQDEQTILNLPKKFGQNKKLKYSFLQKYAPKRNFKKSSRQI